MTPRYKVFKSPLSFADQQSVFDFVINSRYYVGNSDRQDAKAERHKYLCSAYNDEDVSRLGFFQMIKDKQLLDLIGGRPHDECWVNLTTPHNVHFVHAHPNQYTLVYYVNHDWEQDWAGETMVYEDNGVDIHACIPFVPGQVLWLDKNVPHALRPPSSSAPSFRFTLSLFFSDYG